jgi:hypothetical protein
MPECISPLRGAVRNYGNQQDQKLAQNFGAETFFGRGVSRGTATSTPLHATVCPRPLCVSSGRHVQSSTCFKASPVNQLTAHARNNLPCHSYRPPPVRVPPWALLFSTVPNGSEAVQHHVQNGSELYFPLRLPHQPITPLSSDQNRKTTCNHVTSRQDFHRDSKARHGTARHGTCGLLRD